MPLYKQHIKLGIATTALLLYLYTLISNKFPPFTPLHYLLLPFIIYIYSLAPDLDSYFGRLRTILFKITFAAMAMLTLIAFLTSPWVAVAFAGLLGFIGFLLMKSRHRGPLHTPYFTLIIAAPLLFVHWFIFIIAVANGTVHIISDRTLSRLKKWWKKRTVLRTVAHFFKKLH